MDEKTRAHREKEEAAGQLPTQSLVGGSQRTRRKNAVGVARKAARSFSDIKLVEI